MIEPMPLTPSLERLKEIIRRLTDDGISPSFAEIAKAAGYASKSTVHRKVRELRRRGHVEFDDNRYRTIRIVGERPRWIEGLATIELEALRNHIDRLIAERQSHREHHA